MSRKFFVDIDLVANKILGLATPSSRSDGSPKGYVDDSVDTAVSTLSGDLASAQSALEAQIATLESNLTAAIETSKQDVRTEFQGLLNGLPPRKAAVCIATAPITLSGLQTIDGRALVEDERVLVAGQGGDVNTAHPANGIYLVKSGSWVRSADADSAAEIVGGMLVPVNEGTTYGDTQWFLVTDGPFTVDTTPLEFNRYGAADYVVAGDGISRDGNILSVVTADSSKLTVTSSGVGVAAGFIAYLVDLANSTGNLAAERITGLTAFILGKKLNEFTSPDGDVSLAGFKLTNVGTPIDSTDAVNKAYLESQTASYRFSTLVGNGAATTFSVSHGLSSKQVIVEVYDDATGATVETTVTRTSASAVDIAFQGVVPGVNQFRVLIMKVG